MSETHRRGAPLGRLTFQKEQLSVDRRGPSWWRSDGAVVTVTVCIPHVWRSGGADVRHTGMIPIGGAQVERLSPDWRFDAPAN